MATDPLSMTPDEKAPAGPSKEASAERVFTEKQIEQAQNLMDEVPRIEAALKNYLSLKLAEGLVPKGVGDDNVQAASPSASISIALQGCARVLLKAINAFELLPPPAWSQRHPQLEEEGGFEFMARIGNYKVVHALWSRCQGAGQKPAKLLGRTTLQVVYPEVVEHLLEGENISSLAEAARATEEQLQQFIQGFGDTMSDAGSADVDLVWAANMKDAVSARQQIRQADADERVKRAASNNDIIEQIRAQMMMMPEEQQISTGPHIEEIE